MCRPDEYPPYDPARSDVYPPEVEAMPDGPVFTEEHNETHAFGCPCPMGGDVVLRNE